MTGVDPFLRFCLSKGGITLANGARFVIRGVEGQKLYMEQTDKTTASGGGKTDWYSIVQTGGVFSMVGAVPNILVVDSEASQLDDLRTEYNALLAAKTFHTGTTLTTEQAATNLATVSALATSLGITPDIQ